MSHIVIEIRLVDVLGKKGAETQSGAGIGLGGNYVVH